VTGRSLALELHNLVSLEVCLEKRIVEMLGKDKLHDKRGIQRSLLVDNAIIHLLVDVIHHIKWLNFRGLSFAIYFKRIGHEVHQATMNSINVTGLGGNGGSEHAKQYIGVLKEPKCASYDNLLVIAGVKWSKLLLLIVLTIHMHPYPTWISGSMEPIAKESGEVNKVGVTKLLSGHPSHGDLLTIPKHKRGKELLDQSDVVVLLNLHERMETKLASDPYSLPKISTMLCKMREVHNCLRANRVFLERGIKLLHDQLLFLPIKAPVLRVASEFIHVALPHLHKL
jgi:hypothetical protein